MQKLMQQVRDYENCNWPIIDMACAARGPITQLSANKPSDFYNIDYPAALVKYL